jgi:hypothetical protein
VRGSNPPRSATGTTRSSSRSLLASSTVCPVGGDRPAAADEHQPVARADRVRVEVRAAVLVRARDARDGVVDEERIHVRRRGDEQLGAGQGDLTRRLGELDVEADERRDPPPGQLEHDELLARGEPGLGLRREEVGLAVHGGGRAVAVDARDRVRDAAGRPLGEAHHHRGLRLGGGARDAGELLALRVAGERVQVAIGVAAQEELREDGDIDLRVRADRLDRPGRVAVDVADPVRELRQERLHA